MDLTSYLNQIVSLKIDRPFGSKHPKYGFVYKVNYGFVPGTLAPDGEEIDAYVLDVDQPIEQAQGKVIAIIHREHDDDDKLVVVLGEHDYSDEEIMAKVQFQEQWFQSTVLR